MLAYASIWPRRFPLLCISPYDCSADSDSISLYPKRSASVNPPVSKDLDARIPFKFFRSAKRVHPFLRLLLYNLLIGTAVQISVKNPIYAIIALFFMANAEKMFKKIFGFGRAGKGMENGTSKGKLGGTGDRHERPEEDQ